MIGRASRRPSTGRTRGAAGAGLTGRPIGRLAVCLATVLAAGTGSAQTMPPAAAAVSAAPGEAPPAGPPPSVARLWIDAQLAAIRLDFARPPVHARNLHHVSAAMYDAWAVYEENARPLFLASISSTPACVLGRARAATLRAAAADAPEAARRVAIGQAAWRLLRRRAVTSARPLATLLHLDGVAAAQGLERVIVDPDSPAALGARVADCVAAVGAADGSNEAGNHANLAYAPLNPPLDPTLPGNPDIVAPNRWQPLSFDTFVDQSGNTTSAAEFLGAEWAGVTPFALGEGERGSVVRGGTAWPVWLDPGPPPLLTAAPGTKARDPGPDPGAGLALDPGTGTGVGVGVGVGADDGDAYAAHFALTALWSAHLDPGDGVSVDISPGAIGNVDPDLVLVTDPRAQLELYDALEGGMPAAGHPYNPATGLPYAPNRVLRGDYTRVLAEYWADGPDSETPPGHWFRIYNEHVTAHPALTRRVGGEGPELDPLAFDVLAYLALGGAMHDAAIAAWSVKGAYDYVRPISAIRHLAANGRRHGSAAADRASRELPLVAGRIETVAAGDPLAGEDGEHVGKVKLRAWRGPDAIADPASDTAGVGWILAERWWPYQRPTFVTPPFAGYVSGHSTFSRAAAVVLERLTGDAFFPGGLAEFRAEANRFLVFEEGPSTAVTLQWATYRDAADQTALSRIWGGIHPPADDLPGRRMGQRVGELAWARAEALPSADAAVVEAPRAASASRPFAPGCGLGGPLGSTRSAGRSAGSPRPDPTLGLALGLGAFGVRRRSRSRAGERPSARQPAQ